MSVTVDMLPGAVRIVVSEMFCGVPGTRLRVAGAALVPAGRPAIATVTVELKPLTAFAVMLKCEAAAPAVTERDVGDSVNEKSGGGAETVNVTEARRGWSDLLNRVFRREARVIVEKSGIPVAAIISIGEYELFLQMKARRDERFKVLDRMREAFKDVSPEEIEREVAKALAEVRAENRAREQAERGQATREQASVPS